MAGAGLGAFDQLRVDGHLQLGGHLELELIDGFVPTNGDFFVLFDAGSLSGSFALISFLPAKGVTWDVSDLLSEGSVSLGGVVPEPAALLLALFGLALLPRRRR